MPPELDHLSYSSIAQYLSCGQSWYYRYIEKAPTTTSPELVFGSAVHKAIERYIQTKQPLLTLWGECWADQLGNESDIQWGTSTPYDFASDGIRLFSNERVQQMLAAIATGCGENPTVERRIEMHAPGVPIPIIGYIDIIDAQGVPADIKTSARAWTADRAQSELQSLFYLAALNQLGETVPGWRFRHYVLVKTKTPQFQTFEHLHSLGELFWMMGLIQRAWQGIEREVYLRCPDNWKCAPQYCSYWNLCRGNSD
jgi:hypothetical protein